MSVECQVLGQATPYFGASQALQTAILEADYALWQAQSAPDPASLAAALGGTATVPGVREWLTRALAVYTDRGDFSDAANRVSCALAQVDAWIVDSSWQQPAGMLAFQAQQLYGFHGVLAALAADAAWEGQRDASGVFWTALAVGGFLFLADWYDAYRRVIGRPRRTRRDRR